MAVRVLLFQGERSLAGALLAALGSGTELVAVKGPPDAGWQPDSWQPDLIVLDVRRGEASETAKLIRRIKQVTSTPVLIYASGERGRKAVLAAGAEAYVSDEDGIETLTTLALALLRPAPAPSPAPEPKTQRNRVLVGACLLGSLALIGAGVAKSLVSYTPPSPTVAPYAAVLAAEAAPELTPAAVATARPTRMPTAPETARPQAVTEPSPSATPAVTATRTGTPAAAGLAAAGADPTAAATATPQGPPPDLRVVRAWLEVTDVTDAGWEVALYVDIVNEGEGEARGFWVTAYIDGEGAPEAGTRAGARWRVSSLPAMSERTLSMAEAEAGGRPVLAAGDHLLWVWANPPGFGSGAIAESDEGDNLLGPLPFALGFSYETPATAEAPPTPVSTGEMPAASETPADTPTDTPTGEPMPADTPTAIPSDTATVIPTETPTTAPTATDAPTTVPTDAPTTATG